MELVTKVSEMQRLGLQWAADRDRTVLVPTMGALHRGHLALLERARELGERVVMSIFVNPAQFGPSEDLEAYPRPLEADIAAADNAGVDLVFAPRADEIYPQGFQTYVQVQDISRPLCGAFRPEHFQGVATVVLKLFSIVQPQVAVFGWKDAQQFILLRRMVADLNTPVEMAGVETVREPDGLAVSSRNRFLSETQRAAAPAIYEGLTALRDAAGSGREQAGELLQIARSTIDRSALIKIQYLEMVSVDRLEPLERLVKGNTLVAVAAHLDHTRLIDNIRL